MKQETKSENNKCPDIKKKQMKQEPKSENR